MKRDEVELLLLVSIATRGTGGRVTVRDVVNVMGMNRNRAGYILDKWISKGWYECGVSPDLGWLTQAGVLAASPGKLPMIREICEDFGLGGLLASLQIPVVTA